MLGDAAADALAYWGVDRGPNFEGQNILYVAGEPDALRLLKEALNTGWWRADKGFEVEAENFGNACVTEDAMTGIVAFLSKQEPDFKGR